ncbi:type II secretion system inner membrane protein GspF [Crenobacter caeni]|uniref:General secretion pathway protein F n=1 Tax=Crenobacter caeni TaxID=2705474 RepID=A0A6B2KTG4_9NEIS|nr:type II secretion system inner membrane protein GspF [Crenobacter caeni]NDV13350.1 type II secretion system inner membrane protein GspF [Crenobacter caeni]
MALYRYLALDAAGREQKGSFDADNARAARALLRERGLTLVSLDEVSARGGGAGRRLPSAELLLLTQQLSTLLAAGLPLERALQAVAEQSERGETRLLVGALRADIVEGKSLAQAMGAQPQVFFPLYLSLVRAGEQSGHLAEVMARLAEYLERRHALTQKVTLALAYPAVVTVVAVLVVAGLMSYVVPQVVGVFAQTKQTLPLITRLLIAASDFTRHWGWLVALALVAAGFAWRQAMRGTAFRRAVHVRLLALPVIGRLMRAVNTARMASTLAILAGSGVPLLSALETAGGLVTLLPMREALEAAAAKVREGVPLSRSLATGRQFPPVLIQLIASGEQSGKLPAMLERAALQQQAEVERRLAAFTALLEPLLILVMGGVVLAIVMAIMLPIIDMNQMVR